MEGERDPVADGATDSADLYDIATWEPRSLLDKLSTGIYGFLSALAPYVVALFVLVIVLVELLLFGVAITSFRNPVIGAFVLLSVVPAFALAVYIWYADVTTSEPVWLLALTFLLSVVLASFAAIVNTLLQPVVTLVPIVGMTLFFYLVVAPVEEVVKWLAVRLWAFRDARFDAVIDGAVYGAVAGLGFATIENAIYITQGLSAATPLGAEAIATAGQTAAVRLLAGPGHVIYSAFAGYYLGLAKFNRENAGPIVVKGLLIAAFIHATYNTLVTYLNPILELAGVAVAPGVAFIAFVVVYDSFFGYILYRKISRYRKAYRQVDMGQSVTFEGVEMEPEPESDGGADLGERPEHSENDERPGDGDESSDSDRIE
ncbi:PrsW family intramembrane metalloprotease [Halorussus ruber]|uniref:PrsW family intramembrane metalloprotease n=1 Tax=Halorussus ruber TaxID=1126238 RepID=UPI001091A17C|nr:PrsW family intramembrane metalloprotease [Halorussus ruber]